MPELWLRVGLAGAAIMASAGTLQVLIWPARPQADLPPLGNLGLQPSGRLPAGRNDDASRSASAVFAVPAGPTGPAKTAETVPLELQLTSLAAKATELREVNRMTAGDPRLSLSHRRRLHDPQAGGRLSAELALGRLGERTALQTCLLPGGYGYSLIDLNRLVVALPPPDWQARWRQVQGERPARNQPCLLVTLSGQGVGDAELLGAWQRLRPRLEPLSSLMTGP
jgi:hypothetical protein